MGGQSADQTIKLSSNCDKIEKSLGFLTLNVCGLKSKLLIPEFQSQICDFDIVGLQETKCDDYDTLDIPGFNIFAKHRKSYMRRKSGGIAVAYKKWLEQYLSPIETDSKLVLWFQISEK